MEKMMIKGSGEKEIKKAYISIDLKSFYASVECVERGLDPLNTCLVVADSSRTEKTICLAVTPALKSMGIPGRPRLYQVSERVRELNAERLRKSGLSGFHGCSADIRELDRNPDFSLCFHTAPPRMAHYISMSSYIYNIYLKYLSPEDIHVYSVDEIFADITAYLEIYGMTPRELASSIIKDVLHNTGITATCGIGSNLYLAKVAMDIVAKHIPADKDGVRIAELDELSYRRLLWSHRPLSDFWRVGRGYVRRLEELGLYTMGDIARCSIGSPRDFYNEELLYRTFGINAELLIDHAWGYEPVGISDIRSYRPESSSISSGQVLSEPYSCKRAKIVVMEMADSLVYELLEKGLKSRQIVLTLGYDTANLSSGGEMAEYREPIVKDHYGRSIPKPAHGSENLPGYSFSHKEILRAVSALFERIVNRRLLIRRMYLVANQLKPASELAAEAEEPRQLNLFTDYDTALKEKRAKELSDKKELSLHTAMLSIKNRYGKNAVLRGTSFRDGATMISRNQQIGGHKA